MRREWSPQKFKSRVPSQLPHTLLAGRGWLAGGAVKRIGAHPQIKRAISVRLWRAGDTRFGEAGSGDKVWCGLQIESAIVSSALQVIEWSLRSAAIYGGEVTSWVRLGRAGCKLA